MTAVSDILRTKQGAPVHAVAPEDSVLTALQRMAQHDVGALLVMEGETVVGIVSERDYARKIALLGRTSADTLVRDVMSSPVFFVRSHQSIEHCMHVMTTHRLRHLPVVDDGELKGMVSIGDLVKSMMSEQQFIIEQLEQYIAGAR